MKIDDRILNTTLFVGFIHMSAFFLYLVSQISTKRSNIDTHITHVMCKVCIAAYQTIIFYLGIYHFCL